MIVDSTTITILAILFLATVIRSAFGFGEALIAVPLLALLIPVEIAAPVACLVSITVAAVALAQDWKSVHVSCALRLIVATIFGVPLGLLLLTKVPEPIVKGLLAVVIVAFAAARLIGVGKRASIDDRPAWIFGFLAGILGGAYGMNGPPLVVYGTLRGWSPERFRATLQGYFLPASVFGMIGYTLAGLWVPEVSRYFILSLPLVLIAIVAGRMINRRIDPNAFVMCIYVGLVIVGFTLLVQSALASRTSDRLNRQERGSSAQSSTVSHSSARGGGIER